MFLHRVLAPQPLEIEVNDENIQSLSAIDVVVIVGHVRADDWDFWDRFKTLAKHYRDRYSFILSAAGGKKKSSMVCYNNVDDQKHETSEVSNVESLESFVKLCSDPLIPELTRKNEAEYTGVSPPVFRISVRSSSCYVWYSHIIHSLKNLSFTSSPPRRKPKKHSATKSVPWPRNTSIFCTSP